MRQPASMRAAAIIVAFTCGGCHGQKPSTATPFDPDQTADTATNGASSPRLNDVQLDCRSDKMVEIGEENVLFGRQCEGDTMPIALTTFDLGSFDGFLDAS